MHALHAVNAGILKPSPCVVGRRIVDHPEPVAKRRHVFQESIETRAVEVADGHDDCVRTEMHSRLVRSEIADFERNRCRCGEAGRSGEGVLVPEIQPNQHINQIDEERQRRKYVNAWIEMRPHRLHVLFIRHQRRHEGRSGLRHSLNERLRDGLLRRNAAASLFQHGRGAQNPQE